MAIDWIYDTTYVSFGVEWNAAYASGGRVTIAPRVYRWDRYNTIDGSQFWETLYYEPSGATGGPWSYGWGSGSGTREVDSFQTRYYPRRASAYTVQIEIETADGFGTAYDGYFHTIGSVTRTATYYVPALPPSFNTITAARVSDNQVNLSWTAASGNIDAVCIERSVDGGSYSQVAVIWNASATSWQDNTTTADHSYTYRARYHHEGAYGAYSNTVTVTMTPSSPQTITTAAAGGINIDVTLTNPSPVATKVQYEVSTDNGSTWGATQDSASLTTFSVSASGTVKIRTRNVYDGAVPALVSDWLTSDTIVTICPPAAPTLISPIGVLNLAAGSDVTFSWQHNPIDGSAQTAAKLAYSTDGGDTWTTVSIDPKTTGTYTMAIPWSVGTTVTWQMCTKGADASYGPWSSPQQFDVFTEPTLNITSPGATITGMPVNLTATYSDMAGYTCNFASVKLMQNGREVYPNNPNKGTSASGDVTITTVGGAITIAASLTIDEFLPTNRETYTVVVTARSSSGLQTTANASFLVDFTEPVEGALQIINDPETGYASLVATYDNGGALLWNQSFPAVSLNVSRSGWSATSAADNRITVTATQTVSDANSNDFNLTGAFDTSHVYAFLCAGAQEVNVRLKSYGWTSPMIIWPASQGNKYTNVALAFSNLPPGEYTIAPVFVDLTAMYGAGNEPTNLDDPRIEQLRAFAEKHPEVSSGTIYMVAEAESVSVARIGADGTPVPLLTDGASGAGIVDRYAPLNTPYQYAVTTTAASKAVRTVYVDNIISSQRWFAYWGDKIAWARWNPKGGVTITRPEKKRVHYVGRTYPVSYDSLAIDQQNTLKVTALLDEWSDGFADLMLDGGRGVYKGADGSVFWADFEYSTSADYASATRIDEVSLTITRIDGEKL